MQPYSTASYATLVPLSQGTEVTLVTGAFSIEWSLPLRLQCLWGMHPIVLYYKPSPGVLIMRAPKKHEPIMITKPLGWDLYNKTFST